MAKSSIHIKKASSGIVIHNARDNFSHSVVFTDEENELLNDSKTAFTMYRKELKIRRDAYKKRVKQTVQKKTVEHLSAVVNLEQHHTLKDLENIVKHLEKTLDTKVFQVSVHRDEGKLVLKEDNEVVLTSGEDFFKNPSDDKLYFNKKYTELVPIELYNIEKNYHGHIEMLGLDSTGGAIKRNYLNTYYLSDLQTFTAKELKMERGINYKKEGIKAPRRLDVLEFKRENTVKRKIKLATQKVLKSEIAEIRLQLQKQKAKKEKYKELDQLNRELREQIKLKTLSEQDMKEKISQVMNENTRFDDIYYDLKHEINDLEENVNLLKARNNGSLGLNQTLKKEIEKKSNELDSFKLRLNALQEQNSILESKVMELEGELLLRPSIDDLRVTESLLEVEKSKNKDLVEKYENVEKEREFSL